MSETSSANLLNTPFRHLPVTGGTIRYRRVGTGPTVLFVHGVLVNSNLWRDVVPAISDHHDCVVLDLPLGSHGLPMDADAALSPPDLVALLVEVIEKLHLGPVRIVANDSGGALTQMLISRHPGLVQQAVLTSCDAYDYFFPPLFRTLPIAARIPGALRLLANAMRMPWFRHLPPAYGWVTARPIDPATLASYIEPMRTSAAVRRDLAKVLRDVRCEFTLEALPGLRAYDGQVLTPTG